MLKARLLVLAALSALAPLSVQAQQNGTAVMGVITADADTHVELDTSSKFEKAAAEMIEPSQNTMTPRAAMMAHGCVTIDVPCAKKVAQTLGAAKLIWGTISHPTDSGRYKVTLFKFNATTDQIEAASTEEVPSYDVANEMLRLLGVPQDKLYEARTTGLSGSAGGEPPFMPVREIKMTVTEANIAPVVIESPKLANTTEVDVLRVKPEEELMAASPVMLDGKNAYNWRKLAGWASIGVGVAGAALAIGSVIRVMKFDHDPSLRSYRAAFPSNQNVCDAADADLGKSKGTAVAGLEPRVKDVCGAGHRLQVLQWVGLGVGVSSIGAGMYLLLKPVVTARTAGIQLGARF